MLILKYEKNLREFIKKIRKGHILDFAGKLQSKFPGSEVYLVGGAIRDALLGILDQKDYDFVVRGVKARDLEKTLSETGTVNLVGKSFGVFKFRPDKMTGIPDIDIALPRREHSLGQSGGYKDFDVQSDPLLPIEEDLSRRDFTINAIAWNVLAGELTDNFRGLEDLKSKVIRTVGNPKDRFKEDYSRMLRAMRFSCQLGFAIEKNTWEAVRKLIGHINDKKEGESGQKERIVPRETVAKELLKSFYCDPAKALDLWDESGALEKLAPEILKMKGCPQPTNWHSEGDVWTHTRMALEVLHSSKFKKQFKDDLTAGPELVIATLLHDLGKPYSIATPEKDGTDRIRFNGHDAIGAKMAEKICRSLKLSSPEKYGVSAERVAWLVKNHMLFMHGSAREMKNSTIEKYFFSRDFSGEDLLKLGFADAMATIPEKGKQDLENFRRMVRRIEGLKGLSAKKDKLPPPLLGGHEIMKKLGLPSGPRIGSLIKLLREEQLAQRIRTKKEAVEFLKKFK